MLKIDSSVEGEIGHSDSQVVHDDDVFKNFITFASIGMSKKKTYYEKVDVEFSLMDIYRRMKKQFLNTKTSLKLVGNYLIS